MRIHQDIRLAETLPKEFYLDAAIHREILDKIFKKAWLFAADEACLPENGFLFPTKVVDDPILFTKDKNGDVHCMSNVCTHRGFLITDEPCKKRVLTCRYHGRCFNFDGSFRSMPQFEEVENFPSEKDHLHPIPFANLGPLYFVGLDTDFAFAEYMKPVLDRIPWFPWDKLYYHNSRNYTVKANWMLYCDNYLEGFHIPFVHPGLNEAIEYETYAYELFESGSLQIGESSDGIDAHDIPTGTVDGEKNIYAYYFHMFPNLMLNVYPWGLSLNQVIPITHNETRIHYRTYFIPGKEHLLDEDRIHETELEDDEVVEAVQRGLASSFYSRGRYSVSMEVALHHFHKFIDRSIPS